MYAVVEDFNPPHNLTEEVKIDENTSYVSFKLNERYQRLCLWINQVSKHKATIVPELNAKKKSFCFFNSL